MDISLSDLPEEGLDITLSPELTGMSEVLLEFAPEVDGAATPEEGAPSRTPPTLRGHLHIMPIGGSKGFYVHGDMHARLEMACDRCLGPAPVAVDEDFQFQLFPRSSVDLGQSAAKAEAARGGKESEGRGRGHHGGAHGQDSVEDVQLDADSLDVSFFDGDTVPLAELVREQILLSAPLSVLCRASCRGLCQQCGADLNVETCACVADDIDPRLAMLKDLKLPH